MGPGRVIAKNGQIFNLGAVHDIVSRNFQIGKLVKRSPHSMAGSSKKNQVKTCSTNKNVQKVLQIDNINFKSCS